MALVLQECHGGGGGGESRRASTKSRSVENMSEPTGSAQATTKILKQTSLPKPLITGYLSTRDSDVDLKRYKVMST